MFRPIGRGEWGGGGGWPHGPGGPSTSTTHPQRRGLRRVLPGTYKKMRNVEFCGAEKQFMSGGMLLPLTLSHTGGHHMSCDLIFQAQSGLRCGVPCTGGGGGIPGAHKGGGGGVQGL